MCWLFLSLYYLLQKYLLLKNYKVNKKDGHINLAMRIIIFPDNYLLEIEVAKPQLLQKPVLSIALYLMFLICSLTSSGQQNHLILVPHRASHLGEREAPNFERPVISCIEFRST